MSLTISQISGFLTRGNCNPIDYKSTIITFLQTKTNNKKLKKIIKKQLTKHYITLLPFVIFRQ